MRTAISLTRWSTAAGALLLAGCATVTGEPRQAVSVLVVDANDRPVQGMRCVVRNASEELYGNAPLFDVQVRRSGSDLEIECRRGVAVARGTAVSRGSGKQLLSAVLPGGTTSIVVDHLTGYRYTYPSSMKLRVGQHLVFDASDQSDSRPLRGMQAEK